MHQYKMKKSHRGIALISVLLIVALASILVTKMTGTLILQLQRTANVMSNQQAYWYALGAESFAKTVLKATFNEDEDVTDLSQFWAQGETSYPVEGGRITGEILDLQACFNLNALRNSNTTSGNSSNDKTEARLSFERLLVALELDDVDEFTAESLSDSLVDWLDEDSSIVSAGSAEDSDYSGRKFPYLAANNYLASVGELRAIANFTPATIQALKEYVCVIPDSDLHAININTISPEHTVLLQALFDISSSDASEMLGERDAEGYDNVADFFALPSVASASLTDDIKQQIVIDSDYFKLKTIASFNNSNVDLNSVLQVSNNTDLQVIARSIGRE